MFDLFAQETTTKVPVIQTLEDLKPYPRWICSNRAGKLVSPITGQEATTSHPLCWGTYAQAARRLRLDRPYVTGLGFMVTRDLGITVITLEHCLFEGQLTEVAHQLVETYDAYTEIIANGTGLRIWVQGEPMEPGEEERKKGRRASYMQLPATCYAMSAEAWEVR